jgi:hypothetical protein
MSSIAQVSANRSNAVLSTGPRTEQGKLAVAQNARKHGLSGAHVILHGERQEDYDALLDGLRSEHQASGITENFLTEQMAQSQWKLMRIARMEQFVLQPNDQLFALCPAANPDVLLMAQFTADCCQDQTAFKLMRYEAAARRAYMQSLKQLLALQKQKVAAPKPLPAQPVTENYKTKPIPPPHGTATIISEGPAGLITSPARSAPGRLNTVAAPSEPPLRHRESDCSR